MSETYISDLGARSYGSKDGMVTYSSNRNQFQTLLNKQKKSSRMVYSMMTDLELFLEALNKVKGMSEQEYNELSGIAIDIDRIQPNTIKYRSPVGLFYGNKYFQLIFRNNINKIEDLFEEAESNNVFRFDVVRYFRYINKIKKL
jgi:hypothetical protein